MFIYLMPRVRSMTDKKSSRRRKQRKKPESTRVRVYVEGKWVPLSEVAKVIEAPLTKTSRELLSVLVAEKEPVSPKQLASQLKRTQTTIYRSLNNLRDRGLVVKIRRGLVAITEKGFETVRKLSKKH